MKTSFKRYLTIILVVMLSVMMIVLAACNNDDDKDDGSGSSDESLTLTVPNGNFATTGSTSHPASPSNWTSVSTNYSDSVKGVISVNEDTYASYPSLDDETSSDTSSDAAKWYSAANPGKTVSSIKGLSDDNQVLMIYNPDKGYAGYYPSSSLAINAGKLYKLHVSVKTVNVTEGSGAKIYLYGSSATYFQLTDIDTKGEWKTYSIYIQGHEFTNKSVYLYLTLGTNNTYTSAGWAYFDNIYLETVEDENLTYESISVTDLVKKTTTRVPNADFDYLTFSSTGSSNIPALYSATNTGNGNNLYRRVNTDPAVFDENKGSYGQGVANPSTPDGSVGNVYMIYNSALSAIGFKTNATLGIAQCANYKISIWVKTVSLPESTDPNIATVKLTNTEYDDTEVTLSTAGEWKKIDFYVIGSKNANVSLTLELHFGTGNDDSTFSSGWAFFDKLTVEKLAADAVIPVTGDEQTEIDGSIAKRCNLRTDEESLLENGLFENGTDAFTPVFDEGSSTLMNGIDASSVVAGVWDTKAQANAFRQLGTDNVIENLGNYTAPTLPYYYDSDSNKVLAILSDSAGVYNLKYEDAKMVLEPFSYYRLGVWIKTEDVQSSAGVNVSLFEKTDDEDASALSSFTNINTESITTKLIGGWQEVAFYIQTGKEAKTVYLTVSLGSGNKWTSSTLAEGQAFLTNFTLTRTEYSVYNSASGSYAKKTSFVTTTSDSFNNGEFNNYDYSLIEGLGNGGMTGEGADAEFSDNFGAASGWKFNNSNKNGTQLGGIVDLKDAATIANIINEINDSSVLPASAFENMFIPVPDTVTDANIGDLAYIGGDKLLMIASTDAATSDSAGGKVSVGYKSNSASLSASKYYQLSVLVKTVGSANARVYLYGNDNNVLASFKTINTAADTTYNGWTRYTFYIQTNLTTQSVVLGLYIGDEGKETKTAISEPEYYYDGGAAFFDKVLLQEIDAAEFETAQNDDTNAVYSFKTDSFDSFSSTSSSDSILYSPSNWTGKDDTADDDTEADYTLAGVLNAENKDDFIDHLLNLDDFIVYSEAGNVSEDTVFYANVGDADNPQWALWTEEHGDANKYVNESLTKSLAEIYEDKAEYQTVLSAPQSDSMLLIYNEKAAAYSYTSTSTSAASGKYYKVSFSFKTYALGEGQKAYATLTIDGTDYTLNLAADNWVNAEFYVLNSAASSKSFTLKLGMGTVVDETNHYVEGFVMFDDVAIETTDKAAYDSAVAGDTVMKFTVTDDIEPGTEDKEDGDADPGKKNLNWLWISSAVLGAVIIVVVIIYFVQKYAPKKKAKVKASSFDKRFKDNPDSIKNKSDKYKNMKD